MKPRKPGRPHRQIVGREQILRAALSLVDEFGIEGLSMRAVAAKLNVTPMALYNHVPNKEALFDALHESVLDNLPTLAIRTWDNTLRDFARGIRDTLRAHPKVVPLVATRPVRTERAVRSLEPVARALLEAGFKPLEALRVLDVVGTFTVGHVLAEVGAGEGARPDRDGRDVQDAALTVGSPNVAKVFAASANGHDYDGEFEFGMNVLVAGLSKLSSDARASQSHSQARRKIKPRKEV